LRIFEEPNRKLDFIVKSKVPTWYSILLIICMVIILMIWIGLHTLKHRPSIILEGVIVQKQHRLYAMLYLPSKFVHRVDINTSLTLHLNLYPKHNNILKSRIHHIIYTQHHNISPNTLSKYFYTVISTPLGERIHGKKLHEGISLNAIITLEQKYLIDWLTEGKSHEKN